MINSLRSAEDPSVLVKQRHQGHGEELFQQQCCEFFVEIHGADASMRFLPQCPWELLLMASVCSPIVIPEWVSFKQPFRLN
jgi:hypothetical protein